MTLVDLWNAAVARWPHAVAIDVPAGEGRRTRERTTYAELARAAAAIAARVRPWAERDARVAILLPRDSHRLYAAQIGVLQAGLAHVCLDPSFPDDHIRFVLRDAGAVALLTDAAGAARAGEALPRDRVVLVEPFAAAVPPATVTPPPWLDAASLAYVIYTSGTTGRPKGVLLEHRGIDNLIRAGVERFAMQPGDRVAQCSSPAYDSSLEETWLALAAGATVVVLDDATVRLGPDLVAWLRDERVTVFCPPPTLLRAMHCRSPRRELPDLRLCYVGGEALPQDLCDLWAGELWLENGYGPTECSVTVVRGRLQPGRPVTIGSPVRGHEALLLDERLAPVAPGAVGELCLCGPGLARGYLGQPELTAARFPELPGHGRIYRTGDLAQRDADGNLVCLGRVDAQVKLRGYRLELEAVEAALCRHPGVREAACAIVGDGDAQQLVGWAVAVAADAAPASARVLAALRQTLPAYMVPARLQWVAALPRTIGGKLDRRSLSARAVPAAERPALATDDAVEQAIAAAFAQHLPTGPGSRDDDFFALGGDSLRAALVISTLRTNAATRALAVRDLYATPTVRGLADRARALAAKAPRSLPLPPPPPAARASGRRVWTTTACQLAWLVLAGVASSAALFWLAGIGTPWLLDRCGPIALCLLSPLLAVGAAVAWTAFAFAVAVVGKRLCVGAYVPGRVPVWSGLYLRHWLAQRCVRLLPWGLVQGTELQCVLLRRLGARIGRRVHIHRGVDLLHGGWDLLEVGDDATLGRDAHLGLVELDRGELVCGRVRIGAGATLGVRTGVGPDTEVGAGAALTPLSSLRPGTRVPAGELWDGVPARRIGVQGPPPAVTAAGRELSPWTYAIALLGVRLLAVPVLLASGTALASLLGLLAVDASGALDWPAAFGNGTTLQLGALAVLLLPLLLLGQALLLRWTPAVPAGTHRRTSWCHLRLDWRTATLEAAGVWLSGSLLWPRWLRLAGMRIGRDCEVSTILETLPEHTAIGGGSFLADGIWLGAPHVQAGTVTVRPTALGERTFLGNHVVVPGGQQLAADLLLGVCTVAAAERMPAGTAWFGQPPMRLPRREVVTVDRRLTHEPGPLRWCNRLLWELARFLLPIVPLLVAIAWWQGTTSAAVTSPAARFWMLLLPLWTTGAAAALCAFVLALKWLLLARVRSGQHGLWSCWASRWDFLYVAWGFLARRLLANADGTLLLGWYARGMGARIGRRVVLGPGFAQIVDPDMLELGDDSTVDAQFQAHSFEDRVLKIGRVRIGAGATVGHGAVLLYGADIGARAHVAPHSVVMKHERLLPDVAYDGAPTAPVDSGRS